MGNGEEEELSVGVNIDQKEREDSAFWDKISVLADNACSYNITETIWAISNEQSQIRTKQESVLPIFEGVAMTVDFAENGEEVWSICN